MYTREFQREVGFEGDVVFTPSEAATMTAQLLKKHGDMLSGGIRTGLDIDKVLTPMRPRELVVLCGATSNYKSRLMDTIALNVAKQIPSDSKRVIVKATWEQSIEEDILPRLAHSAGVPVTKLVRGSLTNEEWEQVKTAAVELIGMPIWMIGHSIMRDYAERRSRPMLNMRETEQALAYITDRGAESRQAVDLVVLDYLQRIDRTGERGDSIREHFMSMVDRAKNMAIAFDCPVMLGTQAKREVLERKIGLPGVNDGQETSNLEQSADKFLSVWIPIKSTSVYSDGSLLKMNGQEYKVNQNLLFVGIMKQKMGIAPVVFAYHADYEKYTLTSLNRF